MLACAREEAKQDPEGESAWSEELAEVHALFLGADGASSVIVRALWDRLQADARP